MLKKSDYIKVIKLNKDNYLLANLLSGSIIKLNNDEFSKIKNILDGNFNEDSKIFNFLKEQGYLISSDINELNIIKENINIVENDKETLNLTIIPSFKCNFNCDYCYQKGFPQEAMKEAIFEKIFKFIKLKINEGIKYLNINWFGGEPLVFLDSIMKFSQKVIKLCEDKGVVYKADIATNGYLLSQKNIEILKKIKIDNINTTLAGTHNVHDKLRTHKININTFEKIIDNIKRAEKEFKIILSINICKSNIEDVKKLLEYIYNLKLSKNVSLVFNRIESFENNPIEDMCLNNDEFQKIAISLYKKALNLNLPISINFNFSPTFSYCSATLKNSFSIDFKGYLYKCPEIYNEKSSIGFLTEDGEIKFTNNFKKSCFDEECKKCDILPICCGGCNNKKLRCKEFCPGERNYIDEYLKLYTEAKLSI